MPPEGVLNLEVIQSGSTYGQCLDIISFCLSIASHKNRAVNREPYRRYANQIAIPMDLVLDAKFGVQARTRKI